MEAKPNGDAVMTNGRNDVEPDMAGWIFRFSQDGWLRKRWRKRWCVLREDRMHLYEDETTDKCDESIDLNKYQKCVSAGKKENKKSPNTLILEVVQKNEKNKNKAAVKVTRELFYTDTEGEKDKWFEKLNKAITFARTGGGTNLEHVTKSRPKPPGAQRRPPTRRHLRDVAAQSQLLPGIDIIEEEKPVEKKKKGHVPSTAIKPPPPAATKPVAQEKKPVPMPRHKKPTNSSEEVDGSLESTKPTPPPPTPSKALKPKLQKSEDFDEELVISEDVEESLSNNEDIGDKSASDEDVEEKSENDQTVEEILSNDEDADAASVEKSRTPSVNGKSDRSLSSSPMTVELIKLKMPAPSRGPAEIGCTKSLDRRNFGHNIVRSAPSSFTFQRKNSTDTRTILLKAQALETQLSVSGYHFSPLDREKSQSMVILDRNYEDLPPPPAPPMEEALSDIEIKAILEQTKLNKKAKSRSNSKLTDCVVDDLK